MRRERALDDPRFGRAEPCACVLAETGEVRRARLERISNLDALARFTFDSFEPREGMPSLDDIIARARAWAENPEGWLVLRGPSGSGKTHLAAAIANARLDRDEPAYFAVVPDLLDRLRAAYAPDEGSPRFDALFEQVRTTPFLVLDDIDAVALGDWAQEKLYQLVNARYNSSLPTVFTCLTLGDDLNDRIITRLKRSIVLDVPEEPRGHYRQIGGMTRERLRNFSFSSFTTNLPGYSPKENESLKTAWEMAHRFADSPEGWLLIQGENGCGKTHLAAAVSDVVCVDNDVFFAVVPDLLDHLRASFALSGSEGYDETFEDVRNAGLLVLDDLGDHANSDWAVEKLFQIANYRASARLPTVITTDLPNDKLHEIYPRIAVRVFDPLFGHHATILTGFYKLPRRAKSERPNRPRRR